MEHPPASIAVGEWRDDPALDGRQRYWDGTQWTAHVAANGVQYEERYLGPDGVRWQYGVVNVGMFGTLDRLKNVFEALGSEGWELITIYDKASNWFNGMEKGFMLFKRPVPPGVRVADHEWCIAVRDV